MILASALVLLSSFAGSIALQTDWSGGFGQPGPVEEWTDFYNQNNHAYHGTPGEITIQSNGEASGFLPYQPILDNLDQAYSLDIADLDGNGLLDVVSASFPGVVTASFQESGSSWNQFQIADLQSSISRLRIADFDGDGHQDVMVCLYDQGELLWYRNPLPGGTAWEETAICTTEHPMDAVINDMDQDGDQDILWASEDDGVSICWNQNGSGTSWTVEQVDSSLIPASNAETADIDNDGDMDVIASGGDAGGIFLYTAPSWTAYTVDDSIGVVEDLTVGELNGNGYIDLAAVSLTNYRTRTYLNPGDPSGEWESSPVGNQKGICLALADLDQDGDNDLVVSSPTYNYLSVFLREDTGAWFSYQFGLGTSGFSDMALADMNGDGSTDAAGTSYYGDLIAWCQGTTQTTFYATATLTSSILHCDSLDQVFPLFLEADLDGLATMRFRASATAGSMGSWSGELENPIEDVSSMVQAGDSYCQYLVTLYSQGDFTPSTLYQIELTSSPTGTGGQGLLPSAAVSPNPASGAAEFCFTLTEPAPVSLRVFDLGGRVVEDMNQTIFPAGENGMMLQSLSPGLYLLRAVIGGEPLSLKLVVTEGR